MIGCGGGIWYEDNDVTRRFVRLFLMLILCWHDI